MKLILFLGAGVSVPSGLPTADKLTRAIFKRKYHQESYLHFKPGPQTQNIGLSDNVIPRIRHLLKVLNKYDQRDIRRVGYSPASKVSSGAVFRGITSYEDLFYLCEQMRFWSDGRVDNSLVTPMMEVIEKKIRKFLKGSCILARMSDLGILAESACSFIESVVSGELNYTKVPVGLDLIHELAMSPDIEQLNIFTLNHDTLLEQFLTINQIDFEDGFSQPDGDVRWYNGDIYDIAKTKIRIFKLHGSVDWYSFIIDGRKREVILLGSNTAAIKNGKGEELKLEFRRPSFLTGINKAVSYQRGIYADMHFRFHQILNQCECMIMSGYGWADGAINLRLDTWFDRNPRNTLIQLHELPSELFYKSAIMACGYDAWIRRNQLIPITKWLCNTKFNDIKHCFTNSTI